MYNTQKILLIDMILLRYLKCYVSFVTVQRQGLETISVRCSGAVTWTGEVSEEQDTHFTSLCWTKEDKLVPPFFNSDQKVEVEMGPFGVLSLLTSHIDCHASVFCKSLVTRGEELFSHLLPTWPLYKCLLILITGL